MPASRIDGAGIAGGYIGPDGRSQSIAGRLSSPRSINLTLDGQTMAMGIDLDGTGIRNDVNAFTVIFRTSGLAGQTLTFERQ